MRVAVLGVGLIGGSIGLAARERYFAEVHGWDAAWAADPAARARALDSGALDAAAATAAEAVAGAEAVFVAVPVGAIAGTVAEALAAAGPDCVVTDVGSTKRAIVAAASDPRFVGGHPLAGAETAGVAHARGDLFEGATWYLTPAPESSGLLLERLYRLLRGLGARPVAIAAEEHDALLATVSHLPHVLANVLVTLASGALGGEDRLPATGPSFRDATRVAGANTAIWTDIYLSNREVLAERLDRVGQELAAVRAALLRGGGGDREWLAAWNERAAEDRRRLRSAQLAADGELVELRASVPNRPGVVARVALELGRAGVNIADLALYPAADMSEGVIAVWVAGEPVAARAETIVAGLGFPVARA